MPKGGSRLKAAAPGRADGSSGADPKLDPELVDACVSMFLPQMPNIGRTAGLVGPEVVVPSDAPTQDRLLGAMGRQP